MSTRVRGTSALLVMALATAMAMVACGKGADITAPAEGTLLVGIRDNFFLPQTVTVPRGKSVRWTNEGRVVHAIFVDALAVGSDLLAPTWWFEAVFAETGTFQYHCSQHPEMTGTVIVE